MKRYAILLGMIFLFIGCRQSENDQQANQPIIPPNPLNQKISGQWEYENEVALIIKIDQKGNVVFDDSLYVAPWTSVINNVRWVGDTLHYDHYLYCDESHPYSGVLNTCTLRYDQQTDQITCSLIAEPFAPEPIVGRYTRVKSKSEHP